MGTFRTNVRRNGMTEEFAKLYFSFTAELGKGTGNGALSDI